MATVTKNFISSVEFLDDREIMRDVLDVTGEDTTVLDIFEMTGRQIQTDEPEYHNFSNQYRFQSCTISAIDATKNGSGDAGNGSDANILITVTDATQLPIVGEIAMFPDMAAGLGLVIAVGTDDGLTSTQFEAAPLDRADLEGTDPGAKYIINPSGTTVAANDVVTFPSDAAEEGSFAPDPKSPSWLKQSNYVQIFKTAGKVTEMQKVAALSVDYNGSPHILYKIQHDTLMAHRQKIAHGLLIGRKAKYVGSGNKTTYYTQGLINYIKEGDGSQTAGTPDAMEKGVELDLSGNAVSKANFRTVSRALDKRGAPGEYWLWAGGDFVDDMEDNIHDATNGWLGGGGAISYNSFGSGDAKQRAIDLGIDSFRMGGRTWHLKKLGVFDHPEVFAATGHEYAGLAFAIPTGKVKVDLSGNMQERLCVRYAAGDGTDLRYMETLTGALAPVPTSSEAALEVSYESVFGLEALALRQFAIFNE